VWAHQDASRFEEQLTGVGPRGTPTFANGRIYAQSAKAKLICLTASTGQPVWSHDLVLEVRAKIPQWGCASSPLVVDGKVIAFAGGNEHRSLVAFDADSGEQIWAQDGGSETYSSPQVVTLNDERQLLMHDNRGLRALAIDDGKILWERPGPGEMAVPMLQPHVIGDHELLYSPDSGVARLEISGSQVSELWNTPQLKPGFNDFVLCENHIYGLDDGILCCLDAQTGKRLWKRGRYGHGQVLFLADQPALLVLTDTGELVLVAVNSSHLDELCRFQAIEGKTWNHPVIAHGRLYVRNAEEMACYKVAEEALISGN